MKEYAIYPFSCMNISQNYNQGNHVPHWKNSTNYSDKPWDEACKDSGRSYFEPQNDFIIEEILGLGNTTYTNSIRLKSVNKLYTPFKQSADYLYLTLTHMNEDNLKQIKKGDILSKGTKILLEGTDGQATGNHFHITANFGKYYGFKKNSNGAWCFTYEKSLLPEEAFYIDSTFTTVKNSNGSTFKAKPIEEDTSKKEIEALNNQILSLNQQITELSNTINQNNIEIASGKAQISTLEGQVEELVNKKEASLKMVFKCVKNGTYKIKLKDKEELYIK